MGCCCCTCAMPPNPAVQHPLVMHQSTGCHLGADPAVPCPTGAAEGAAPAPHLMAPCAPTALAGIGAGGVGAGGLPAHIGADGLYDGGGRRPVRLGAAGRARHGGLLAAGLHGAAAASAAVGLCAGGGNSGAAAAAFLPSGADGGRRAAGGRRASEAGGWGGVGVGAGLSLGSGALGEDLFTMHADGLLTRHRLALLPAAGGGDSGSDDRAASSLGSTPDSVLAAAAEADVAEVAAEAVEQWALLRRRSWPEREAELPGVVRAAPYPTLHSPYPTVLLGAQPPSSGEDSGGGGGGGSERSGSGSDPHWSSPTDCHAALPDLPWADGGGLPGLSVPGAAQGPGFGQGVRVSESGGPSDPHPSPGSNPLWLGLPSLALLDVEAVPPGLMAVAPVVNPQTGRQSPPAPLAAVGATPNAPPVPAPSRALPAKLLGNPDPLSALPAAPAVAPPAARARRPGARRLTGRAKVPAPGGAAAGAAGGAGGASSVPGADLADLIGHALR